MSDPLPADTRPSVFISYSRVDSVFAKKLHQRLEKAGYKVWFDVKSIPPSVNFWAEIKEGIEGSDCFLMILSPDYTASQVCNQEVEYALKLEKKLALFAYRDDVFDDKKRAEALEKRANWDENLKKTLPAQNWKVISSLNAIKYDPKKFNKNFQTLQEDLDTNREYVKYHTHILRRAAEWDKRQRASGFLRGNELRDAETWLASPPQAPHPSDLQRDFIQSSRRRQNRDLNLLAAVLGTAAVITFIFAIVALLQRNEAQRQRGIAIQQRDIAEARLQSAIIENRSVRQGVGEGAYAPVLAGLNLWVSHREDGTLWRLRADTGEPIGTPIEVGEDALSPFYDGQYLWVASVKEKHLLQVTESQVLPAIPLGAEPQSFFSLENTLWVVTRREIIKIDKMKGQVIETSRLGSDLRLPVFDGLYLWVVDGRDNTLHAFNTQSGEINSLPLDEAPLQTVLAGEYLWVITDNHLIQITPTQIVKSHSLSSLTSPVVDGNFIWFIQQSQIVKFSIENEAVVRFIPVNHPLRSLYLHEEKLWVFARDHFVMAYDTHTYQQLSQTLLPDSDLVTAPVFTESHLWVANSLQQRILSISLVSGSVEHELQHCAHPTQPTFDGINLWFACRNDEKADEILRVPAHLYYHGIGEGLIVGPEELEQNSRSHTPFISGKSMWLIQEAEGVLLVIDTHSRKVIGSVDLDQYPPLPLRDGKYLWVSDGQHVLRFDMEHEQLADYLSGRGYQNTQLPGEAGTLYLTEHRVWVLVRHENAFDDSPPDIGVFDRNTGRLLYTLNLGYFVIGLTASNDGTVWVSAVYGNDSRVLQLDERSGQILNTISLDYSVWTPLLTPTDIWMGGGFPGGIVGFTPCLMEGQCPGTVYRFDRATLQPISLPDPLTDSITRPFSTGNYIWLLRSTSLPVITAPYARGHGQLTAMDSRTGRVKEIFTPCENILPPLYDENTGWLWVACIGIGDDPGNLMVINTTSLEKVAFYENLGREAWPPVKYNNQIWITYRDTNNAVVFDTATGAMIRVYGLGNAPSPPAFDKDQIWFSNSEDGTIAHILSDIH